jgi:hypothetical protein
MTNHTFIWVLVSTDEGIIPCNTLFLGETTVFLSWGLNAQVEMVTKMEFYYTVIAWSLKRISLQNMRSTLNAPENTSDALF